MDKKSEESNKIVFDEFIILSGKPSKMKLNGKFLVFEPKEKYKR